MYVCMLCVIVCMCMSVCVCVCMYACVCMCMNMYVCIGDVCVCMCVCVALYAHIFVQLHIHVPIHVWRPEIDREYLSSILLMRKTLPVNLNLMNLQRLAGQRPTGFLLLPLFPCCKFGAKKNTLPLPTVYMVSTSPNSGGHQVFMPPVQAFSHIQHLSC